MEMIFDFIKQIFAIPFGYLMGFFYNISGSYIFAIVLLTILVKLCFLPGAIKQKKDMIKTAKLNKELNNLKSLYADDEEKLKNETAALKAKYNTSKKNIGCATTFIIQFVVLIGLFNIIYTPLTNVLQIKDTTIEKMKTTMPAVVESVGEDSNIIEISLLKEIENYKDPLLKNDTLTEEEYKEISVFQDKYTFMGIDLSESPEIKTPNALWFIPLLVLSIGILSSLYSHIQRKKRNPGKGKFTTFDALPFITPMISFLFTFMFPAGVGLYWALSNGLSFIQNIILNAVYKTNVPIQTETQI